MELIEPMTRDQMLAWRQRNYLAPRIVVCAAGNIDHKKFAAEAARLFGDLPGGDAPTRATPTFHSGLLTAAKPLDQTHIVLTFPAPSYRAPEIYQLQVLSNLLGGGMSSRLFQEVREKRGLCYNVFAFGSSYEDVGQIGLYAAATPDHTAELLAVSSDVMMSAARDISPVEVARAKAQLKAALVMNLESASSRADQIARQYLAFGMVPKVATLMEKIEAVTVDQVKTLAQSLFASRVPALSAGGQLARLSSPREVAAPLPRQGVPRRASCQAGWVCPIRRNFRWPRHACLCACRRWTTMGHGWRCAGPRAPFWNPGSRPGGRATSRPLPSASACGAAGRWRGPTRPIAILSSTVPTMCWLAG